MVSACVSLEPYALRVLDDSMAPEVPSGTVVVVDPGEPAEDGSLVVLEHEGEVVLRRLSARAGRRNGCRRPMRRAGGAGDPSRRGVASRPPGGGDRGAGAATTAARERFPRPPRAARRAAARPVAGTVRRRGDRIFPT